MMMEEKKKRRKESRKYKQKSDEKKSIDKGKRIRRISFENRKPEWDETWKLRTKRIEISHMSE